MKIVTIDETYRRDGHCNFCHLPRTVFAVKREDGSWTTACKGCAEADGAKAMV